MKNAYQSTHHPTPPRFTVAILAVAALCAADVSQTAAAERPSTKTTGSLRVRVVDRDGHAIPGAKIHVGLWTNEKDFKAPRDYTCDKKGEATVKLPASLEIIRVWARSPGYAPMFAQLWPQSNDGKSPLPDEFTYVLTKGTTMGGVVKNDTGEPIKGAHLDVQYDSGGLEFDAPKPTNYDSWLANDDDARVTDAQGRWSLDNVPPGDRVAVLLKLRHPDYINDKSWGGLQKEQNVTSEQLRDQSTTVVMHRGYVVQGKITDPAGEPVKKAVVIWGDRPYWEEGSQEVRTDENGNYLFPPLPAGPVRITVAAKGWMPQMKTIEIGPEMRAADFQLGSGKNLRIKFVDQAGKPMPKVYVGVSQWRGAESLYSHRHPNVIDVQIPNKANKEGLFEWTWAPDDAVEYRFSQRGYADTTATITADDTEHCITVHPVFQIAGTVTDEATGKPIECFRILPVIHFRPDFPFIDRRESQEGTVGKLRIDFDRTDIEHGVQIEAPGYVTFRTERRYKIGDVNPTLDIRLKSTEPYAGTVVDADGRPAKNAQVFVSTGFQHLDLDNLADNEGSDSSNYRVTADEEGAFEIVPQIDRYAVIVVAPDGYAEIQRAAAERPGKVRLQPWASVRGRVVQDGKPIGKYQVGLDPIRLGNGDNPNVDISQRATTENDGTFRFDRVPPMACRVRPYLHFSRDSVLKSSRSLPLEPAPGSETVIELEGNGAEITGSFVVDPPREPFDYHFSLTYLVAKRPGIKPPSFLADKEFDWRKGWSDSWFQSQEGGVYLNTLHNWFVKPDPDGQFRISGVPPGQYQLAVNLYGTTEGCLVHPVARVIDVDVPANRPTIDLGKVTIPTQDVPKVGDVAANFKLETPEGKPTDLEAQRGKYVLVDFWATWCGPCVSHLPEVDALSEEFCNERLLVVGANLDSEPDTARAYLKKNSLGWHHAFLGEWSSSDVPKRYGVSTVPAYVLIGPDGRIAAFEYSTDKLRERLRAIGERR